jgi:hypothetical protein
MMTKGSISIWFFIGALLLVYGLLITGAGIYGVSHPPNVRLAELNATLWWGILLVILGGVYTYAFFPGREAKGK